MWELTVRAHTSPDSTVGFCRFQVRFEILKKYLPIRAPEQLNEVLAAVILKFVLRVCSTTTRV